MDLEGEGANPLASHHVAGTLWWGGPLSLWLSNQSFAWWSSGGHPPIPTL